MQVRLKVIGGKNDGREIKISVPRFIIGRGEQAHLRPASDMVSRQHCAVIIGKGEVIVEDLGSRNGTFVNGKALEAPHKVQVGDTLRVGRLQFELVLDHAKPGNKKPKINSVVEAAAKTKQRSGSLEESITDWLSDDLDDQADNKTVHFNLEESMALSKASSDARKADAKLAEEAKAKSDIVAEEKSGEKKKKKKKAPGKLPKIEKSLEGDSTSAADDVLRKFFNNR